MWACSNGHLDIVKVLIDNGADIDDKSKVSYDSLLFYGLVCLVKVCIVWMDSTNVGMS